MSSPLVIIGTGEGRCVLETCRAAGRPVAGFLNTARHAGEAVLDCQVLGGDALLDDRDFVRANEFLVGVGDGSARARYVRDIKKAAGRLAVPVVHPSSIVSPYSELADGTVILCQCAIHPEAEIGEASVIDAQVNIGHDAVVGPRAFIGPGCTIAGRVRIGAEVFLGIGVNVIPNVTIRARSIVGAGAVVTADIPEDVVAVGNPAKVIKARSRAA